MCATAPGNGFSARYFHDDKMRRRDFDRRLAGYLRGRRERWDITAIVEPLQLLGPKAQQVDVYLARGVTGKLSVTISFELAPDRADEGARGRSSLSSRVLPAG